MKNEVLSEEQEIQESQYEYPYHYLPTLKNGNFRHFKVLNWGYEYLGYIHYVINYLKPLKGINNLLDVGCGDGRFIAEAQDILPFRLFGVDYSKHAIKMAQVMNPKGDYQYGDITAQGLYDQKFEVITLIEVLEHIPPDFISDFLKGISQYLTDQGQLIITVPSTNVPVNKKHYQHFNPEVLEASVIPHFKIEKLRYLNKIGWKTRFIESMMNNRFFILKQRHLVNWLFNSYRDKRVPASPSNGKRLFAVCKKS